MTTARQTIIDASKGEGCLGRARDDEPVFVLRGQDTLAPSLVENWAVLLLRGRNPMDLSEKELSKIKDARQIAEEMRQWQGKNGRKFPD